MSSVPEISTNESTLYGRIVGDAGCFIDPLFSSGVHLAISSGLSAAVTICAARRGDYSEETAEQWHTRKVAKGYTRFLLVVTGSLHQIYGREEAVLNDLGEHGFDRAFEFFRPIIQGTVEVGGKLTHAEVAKSVDFCTRVLQKVQGNGTMNGEKQNGADDQCEEMVDKITQMHRVLDLDNFTTDAINGMAPNLKRGALGLVKLR